MNLYEQKLVGFVLWMHDQVHPQYRKSKMREKEREREKGSCGGF
jgi:hypothetical protein